jgi:predicted RND superfamily exporter protein
LERVGPAPQTATVERDYAGSLRAADLARAGDSLEGAFSFLAGLGYRAFRFEPEGLVPVALPVTCDFWWFDPFVVILASPTALAGIIWILFATGTTLSVPALTGAIMCMRVGTANSILVIAFARERMAAGADAITAAMEAGSTRIRPVLMTALAMVIGMVPKAIEPGQNTPLGRAVIGGLIFATSATLFLVPTVFSLVHGRAQADRGLAARPRPAEPRLILGRDPCPPSP